MKIRIRSKRESVEKAFTARSPRKSIRNQLILGVALVHLLLMSIFVIDVSYRQRSFLAERAKTRVLFQDGLLATSSIPYVIVDDLAGLSEVVDAFLRDHTVRYAMVTDIKGRILAHSDHSKSGQYLHDPVSLSVFSGPPAAKLIYDSPLNVQAVTPITVGNHTLAWAWLGIDRSPDEQHLEYVTRSGALYILFAVLVGTAFAILLAATITRPLRLLLRGAERLSQDRLDKPVPITTRNEVGTVTFAFNNAMARLARQRSELNAARDELEKRVEERTRELARANAILEQEIRERTEAQEALRKAHAQLEDRVRERTAELAKANQALKAEIGERRRAEHALKEANTSLARSNTDLEQFAYAASHDLQEPLRTIRNFMELLRKRYHSQLDATALEFIDYAVKGADRMQALVRDLLAYSRIGRSKNPRVLISCNQVLEMALNNLHVAIENSGTKVNFGELPSLLADEVELVQLFQNLVSNAIKYRGDQSPRIDILASRIPQEWLFEVRDNGIGIPPEQQKRIFGVFQRLHGSEYPGTGIGLATCAKIVEHHGGRIWVESQPGLGSTFKFTIHDPTPDPTALLEKPVEYLSVQ
ncbi:MAG TPA: ATP-binding protein [Bryobacteraceae bacterium]|nr:ATP-binding protein [Bryobacteraceae bacterium]